MSSRLLDLMVANLPLLKRASDSNSPYPLNYTTNGHTCDMPRPIAIHSITSLSDNSHFTNISLIITLVCACFTTLSQLVLMFRHATHLSRPNEQLSILRICCYLPIFSIGCFLEILFPNAYVYINPWLDFAQALALCSFFLMMCQFVAPSDTQREQFFAALQVPQGKKNTKRSRRSNRRHPHHQGEDQDDEQQFVNGLVWYRRMWLCIFQYPVVQGLVAILTCITESQAVYCLVSSKTHFAHLWLDILHNISLTIAVMACLRLLRGLKGHLAHHRPLLKLAAFKLLIAFTGIIQLVYWILRSIRPSPLAPTATLSWFDVFIGIPVLIMAVLAVPFSVLFHFAYDVQTYYLENVDRNVPLAHKPRADVEHAATAAAGQDTASIDSLVGGPKQQAAAASRVSATAGSAYQGGFLGIWAWLGMLNPSELVSGLVFGLTMLDKQNLEAGVETVRRRQTGEF